MLAQTRAMLRTLLAAFAVLLAVPAHADRIKDLGGFQGIRSNQLTGYGIVVGLPGTGDDNLEYTVQSVKAVASRFGLQLPAGANPGLKNAAVVLITAELPPFAKPGQRLDITVASMGKAKSLRGGSLILTPLLGADGQVYAMAQGNLAVGGLGAEGADGSKIVVNIPSTGRIPEGATVERAVQTGFETAPVLTFNLQRADFTTAQNVAGAINRTFGAGTAQAIDASRSRSARRRVPTPARPSCRRSRTWTSSPLSRPPRSSSTREQAPSSSARRSASARPRSRTAS